MRLAALQELLIHALPSCLPAWQREPRSWAVGHFPGLLSTFSTMGFEYDDLLYEKITTLRPDLRQPLFNAGAAHQGWVLGEVSLLLCLQLRFEGPIHEFACRAEKGSAWEH